MEPELEWSCLAGCWLWTKDGDGMEKKGRLMMVIALLTCCLFSRHLQWRSGIVHPAEDVMGLISTLEAENWRFACDHATVGEHNIAVLSLWKTRTGKGKGDINISGVWVFVFYSFCLLCLCYIGSEPLINMYIHTIYAQRMVLSASVSVNR